MPSGSTIVTLDSIKLASTNQILLHQSNLQEVTVDREHRTQNIFSSEDSINQLWQYVQSLNADTIAQLSQPESKEVFQVMEQNIVGLLGSLPSEHFEISINTNREHLGRLLASAMMSGYFIRNAEQRMAFDKSLQTMDNRLSGEA